MWKIFTRKVSYLTQVLQFFNLSYKDYLTILTVLWNLRLIKGSKNFRLINKD